MSHLPGTNAAPEAVPDKQPFDGGSATDGHRGPARAPSSDALPSDIPTLLKHPAVLDKTHRDHARAREALNAAYARDYPETSAPEEKTLAELSALSGVEIRVPEAMRGDFDEDRAADFQTWVISEAVPARLGQALVEHYMDEVIVRGALADPASFREAAAAFKQKFVGNGKLTEAQADRLIRWQADANEMK